MCNQKPSYFMNFRKLKPGKHGTGRISKPFKFCSSTLRLKAGALIYSVWDGLLVWPVDIFLNVLTLNYFCCSVVFPVKVKSKNPNPYETGSDNRTIRRDILSFLKHSWQVSRMKSWVILSLITHGRINFSAWLVFTFTKFWFIRYLKPRIFSRFLSVAIKFKATLNYPNQASILRWKMTLDVREGACGYTCLSTLYSLFLKNRWLSKWFKMCILINRCRQIEIPTSLSVLITGVNSLIQLRYLT